MSDQGKPRQLTDEELAAPIGTIPLPPEALREELDNQAAAKPATPAAKPDVAELEFVDGPPGETIPLRYPFRLDGQVVSSVRVRPLSVTETSEILSAAAGALDSFDFYAAMAGLPAAVVRALPGEDGQRVTRAAYGFLPRFMRADDSVPTPASGAA